jgi:hypothetical protein
MTDTKANLRIKGLVQVMNCVRDRLRVGIPAEDVDEFRDMVTDTVRTVEVLCRKHHIKPELLPAPSRRAYLYLKGLDLNKLPIGHLDTPAAKKEVRLTGVVTTCDYYHHRFARLAAHARQTWEPSDADVAHLVAELRADADAIDALCREEEGTPADLSVQSQRAYQWLAFLADPENLAQHLSTLAIAIEVGENETCRKALPVRQRTLPLRIDFYATSTLYRTRVQADAIRIVANEGFLGAPRAVIEALVHVALGGKGDAHRSQMKAYAASEDFMEVLLALELTTAELSLETRGRHYDLAEVFDRVNAAYFDGKMPRPRLTWNKTLTHRKLGHYRLTNDTLEVSMTLDDVRVPPYVLEFVVYHELLHKQLGIEVVNGRRYAHTSEFRARERRFRHYDKAQDFLKQMGKVLDV